MLQEELGERVLTSFDFDVGFYRGNKQVWMRSDNELSILKIEIIEIAQKSLRHVMKLQGRVRRRKRHTKTNNARYG